MKKNWIVGFVVICLCVAIVFAQTQLYKGTQWEYAFYYVATGDSSGIVPVFITFLTPTERFDEVFKDNETNLRYSLWKRAGFNFNDTYPVRDIDWFNYLGKQRWELTGIEINNKGTETSYWFKRQKTR